MDAFKVLTEFRFDVGSAVINSQKLQDSVNKLGDAADDTKLAFESLRAGIVGSFSLSQFGLLGTLHKAVQLSDSFNKSALSMSQMMAANMNYLSGDIGTFNKRLELSKDLIDSIGDAGGKLGLNRGATIAATQTIAATLIPSHMAGTNFQNAQTLAMGGLGVGKALGISGAEIGKEIAGVLSASSDSGGPSGSLFSALVGSTKTFAQFKQDATDFSDLPLKERMDLMNKGLKELKTNLGTTGTELVTISDFMAEVKDALYGVEGILRPIGDAVLPFIIDSFKELTHQINTVGRDVFQRIGRVLKDALKDPKKLIEELSALSKIGSDFNAAKAIVGTVLALQGALKLLKSFGYVPTFSFGGFFKSTFNKLGGAISEGIERVLFNMLKADMFSVAGGVAILKSVWSGLSWILNGFAEILGVVVFPILVLTSVFQGIRRAWDGAKIDNALKLVELAPKIAEVGERIYNAVSNIMTPFTLIADGFYEMLKPLFDWLFGADIAIGIMEKLAGVFEFIGKVMVLAFATISGAINSLFQLISNVGQGKWAHLGEGMGGAFNDGVEDFIKAHMHGLENGQGVSQMVQNNNFHGGITIKNDFKENQEPDRIAFTIKEQILQAAQNPKQARGQSLQSALASSR